jgi:hypothetical protein
MGSEGFDIYIDQVTADLEARFVPAAMKAVEYLRTYVAEQTPVETGHLRGSEETRPMQDGAELFIPGPYARNQHYTLHFHHNVGNALYLELPWMQHAKDALGVVATELGGALA